MSIYRSLGTVNSFFEGYNWPGDFVMPENIQEFLDRIYVIDYRVGNAPGGKKITIWLAFEGELSVALPGLKGVKLVALGGDTGGLTFVTGVIELGDKRAFSLQNLRFSLRFDPKILKPATLVAGGSVAEFVEIKVEGAIHINSAFDISVTGFNALELTPAMIGNSGIIIAAQGVKLDLLRTSAIPEVLAAGFDDSFIGVYIGEAMVKLPEDFPSLAPEDLVLKKCAIGSGGVSGRLEANYSPDYDEDTKTFSGKGAGNLFGIPFGLEKVAIEFKQNAFLESSIVGKLLLPFFDEPVAVDIGIDLNGDFSVKLTSAGSDGLYKLTKPDILEMELHSIGFEVKDGLFTAKLSGQITPLFGKDKGLDWPGFKVEELSIDSHGHVHLQGGWLALPDQYDLDFNGFHIGITKLGFGKTEDGGKWVGFSGDLKLVDGFTAGASVEGLRITWYEDGRDPKISFNGIGVEFEIPDVLRFKGDVSYQTLEVNGEEVHRFDGDIKLELISLKLEIDAKLVIGSANGPQGKYNFFAIYLGVELPTGIPLGATPLALYGMAGLFALQMEPNKTESQEWYDDWYKKPTPGVTDLESKWVNHRGSLALGGGVTIGTISDNGFTFACEALLVIVFPGPIILIEGKANLLKERAKLNDDPMFRSLAVIDTRENQILIGLDAQYKQDEQTGKILDIRAGAEAFFHTPSDWHIYMGEREPRDKRIRARFLQRSIQVEANAYFMLDSKRLAVGAWVGFDKSWKFGPVGLALSAWIESNVAVNWNPMHFYGDLWLHGSVEVSLFGLDLGLSVDARFAADVFDPFHVVASLEISIKLPRPLKKKHIEITLEWGPIREWPKQLPLPLKEIAIEHFKVTTSWPLTTTSADLPPTSALQVVPLDCRPHIGFERPVHDDALVSVNPQPVQPEYEYIGDPDRNEGPVRVRYGLKEIELAKWDEQKKLWQTVARKPTTSGVRTLYGSWAPMPQLPTGTDEPFVANVKLWLWSKTPFDYTRHSGSDWDDWFTSNFPNYPCVPQEIPDREVCIDFEKLDRAQFLKSPWRSPEHPEITLSWLFPERQRVTMLDPPVDGFTHALCFPAEGSGGVFVLNPPNVSDSDNLRGNATPIFSNTVTITLTAPAKRVKLLVVEGKKADKVCLNFRNRKAASVKLPMNEQNVTIGPGGVTTIAPVPTTLGDIMGLNCSNVRPGVLDITLPCAASMVELNLTYLTVSGKVVGPLFSVVTSDSARAIQPVPVPGLKPPDIVVFDSNGKQVAVKPMLNPERQPEIVRFEGNDLKQIRILSAGTSAFLHEICFLCPDKSPSVTAIGFDANGRPTGTFANNGNVVEVIGNNLTQVQVKGKGEICLLKICALFGPDPNEVKRREEMDKHMKSEVARWQKEGEVLEPFSAYRLKIVTATDAYGERELSSEEKHLTQTEYAYFRTEGPPGLTTLSLPAGRDADKFDSGLEDLTRYVRQTIPATVPATGEKPVMARPFYRAYDIGVEFNEDYVDLMYRISGRDLGLYLYDSNNRPVRDAGGRLLVQSGDWGAVEELTLTEGEKRWLMLSHARNGCLPFINQDAIVHDKKLTSAIAGRVLEPDTVYEARLIPLLLREGFLSYALAAAAQGPAGKLGRWEVRDEGNINKPSKWEVRETGAPPSRYLIQMSNIKGGSDDAADPVKPGTMLLFGNDPALAPGHKEQPTNWTDYRLSVYLHAAGDGAIGVVFRYRDGNNYYRLSLDRQHKYRRLIDVANGVHTILKQDDFTYQPNQDYLITVEAIGSALRVYQDGALVFEVTDIAHPQGSIGLYCFDNPDARFSDVRVDDFRQTAQAVYRYQFTTSLFANFFHHLHSYQDETWRAAVAEVVGAHAAIARAVNPTSPPNDDEARAYETLATAVLGQAARQNPREVQVTRVEIDDALLAFLVQSPEPIEWLRTELAFLRTGLTLPQPTLPGKVKLAAVNFGANKNNIESVSMLLREQMSLTGYRIDSRLVTWQLNPMSEVFIDAQALSQNRLAESSWTEYHKFGTGPNLPVGTVLQIPPDATTHTSSTETTAEQQLKNQAGRPGPIPLSVSSVELRIVAPDGLVVHSKHFLPDNNYIPENVAVLRKADGTGVFIIKLNSSSSGLPFSAGQYRLKLTYRRNNRVFVPASQVLSEAGNQNNEIVMIDIP